MNRCCSCGHDFNSVKLFDRHRIGKHAYDFAEGLNMDPPREDGRRCLDPGEMTGRGWTLNKRNGWIDPVTAAAARQIESGMRRGS